MSRVELRQVRAWTDGACSRNPGPGGYGVVLTWNGERRELSGGFRRTTNNRMEILAVIVTLEALTQRCAVEIHSDSQYVVHSIALGWAKKWRANGWRRGAKGKELALNPDLWERLLARLAGHEVKMVWVRGHAGEPENERADQLAVAALAGPELAIDEGYERAG